MSSPPLRILFLHGYTQSGPLFQSKTGALRKALTSTFSPCPVHFTFPTGPLRLKPEDVPGYQPNSDASEESLEAYGWWRRKDPSSGSDPIYEGLDSTFDLLASEIKEHGPFDGVIGFSQGACLAGMLASIFSNSQASRREAFTSHPSGFAFPEIFLSPTGSPGGQEMIQPPFKFVVLYSGFAARGSVYRAFRDPVIDVRSLHVLGGLDTVVDEDMSQELVDAFAEGFRKVVVHPGGHFVPAGKVWLGAVVAFVKEAMDGKGEKE